MDGALNELDWSLVQGFLAVAETGSLSGAARALGLSQPTVGRQVRQVENRLDVTLFRRHPRGLELTETGAALLPHARAMQEAMNGFSLAAAGRTEGLRGTVRITSSVVTALYHLPPIVARIRALEPEVAVEIVPDDASRNLLFREADIAVRMYRPEQLDIVARYLGELELGFYAARAYLDRTGRPETVDEMWRRDLVGMDRGDTMIRGFRDFGVPATRDWFATRCDDFAVAAELVRAGCGIGIVQCVLAEGDPGLERLFPETPVPRLPLWLAAPEAMRGTPRIRRVWDLLGEGLAPLVS
ncbi:LysR family transcriptional regulator [Salipiger mucosus]|uniref:Transcriptional regulator, LysR family n=1 Tax=Salipiger mucosus DSM 16094 TaxID=1123237 RepID=S9RYB7_9RHOB|nr:LysR family transcriptional regulator [Salipiger mucosus]EPX83010.1 Transcriptional regulator, LysR family [Salipiger mucosus DSM 16094]